MPALSSSQQRLFGMALAHKRGDLPQATPAVRHLAASVSESDLHDFAATKRKGLPKHKGESKEKKSSLSYGF